jgi:exonuclease VII small subunit
MKISTPKKNLEELIKTISNRRINENPINHESIKKIFTSLFNDYLLNKLTNDGVIKEKMTTINSFRIYHDGSFKISDASIKGTLVCECSEAYEIIRSIDKLLQESKSQDSLFYIQKPRVKFHKNNKQIRTQNNEIDFNHYNTFINNVTELISETLVSIDTEINTPITIIKNYFADIKNKLTRINDEINKDVKPFIKIPKITLPGADNIRNTSGYVERIKQVLDPINKQLDEYIAAFEERIQIRKTCQQGLNELGDELENLAKTLNASYGNSKTD